MTETVRRTVLQDGTSTTVRLGRPPGGEVTLTLTDLTVRPVPVGAHPDLDGLSTAGEEPPRIGRKASRRARYSDAFTPIPDPVWLAVRDLKVVVPDQPTPAMEVARRLGVRKPPRKLIDGITFAAEPGNVVGVIGPAGAGKSTLMKALIGAQPARGTIEYNGRQFTAESAGELRFRLGYVPQADTVHTQLSARQALAYRAELQMLGIERRARQEEVDRILRRLGLEERADQPIETLSGGQSRRVSVAPELLTRQPVLFLDEPTTGLDPHTKLEVFRIVQDLAHQGNHTVIVITHDESILPRCDQILVIGKTLDKDPGRLLCYAKPREVLAFFGAGASRHMRDDERPDRAEAANVGGDIGGFAEVYRKIADGQEDWAGRFRRDELYQRRVVEPLARCPRDDRKLAKPQWVSPLHQVLTLARRNHAVVRGSGLSLKLQLGLQAPLMMGLLMVFCGLGNLAQRSGSEPRQLLAFLVVAALAMGLINSCREIVKELAVYRRELAVGLSLGAYVASKFLYLVILSATQAAILSAVMTGQGGSSGGVVLSSRAVEVMLVLLVATVAAVALGLMISALVTSDAVALVLIPVILISQLLLTGAFRDVEGRPVIGQIAWVTPAYWTFNALAVSSDLVRVEGKCFRAPATPPPSGALTPTTTLSCSDRWKRGPFNFVISIGALALLCFAYLTAAVAALRRRNSLSVR